MKFVLGLLAGMIGVVSLSTLSSLEWGPPERMKDAFAPPSVVESNLPLTPRDTEVVPVASVTIEPLVAEPEPSAAPRPEPDAAPARVPIEALRPNVAEPQIEAMQPNVAEPQSLMAEAESSAEASVAGPATDAAASASAAVVWKPFHSEVSAQGFARRLSVQLGYPFRAQRIGPATYHVVFDYATDEQRELLYTQVHQLTGFRGL